MPFNQHLSLTLQLCLLENFASWDFLWVIMEHILGPYEYIPGNPVLMLERLQ